MNDQLDKLESSIARLVQAYNELKAENASLKAQLADKTAAVERLEVRIGAKIECSAILRKRRISFSKRETKAARPSKGKGAGRFMACLLR